MGKSNEAYREQQDTFADDYEYHILELATLNCTPVDEDDLFYDHLVKTYGKIVDIAGVNRNIAEVLSQLGEYDDRLEEWLKDNEDLFEFKSSYYLKSDIEEAAKEIKESRPQEPADFTGVSNEDR